VSGGDWDLATVDVGGKQREWERCVAVDGRSKIGQNDPLALTSLPLSAVTLHCTASLCPRVMRSSANITHLRRFCAIFRLSTIYTTTHLTTQSFSQYCNLSAYHNTAGSPDCLSSLHARFKVEHLVDVVPEFSMKILVVGDCELVQLTPPGLREGYCAARYMMRFSEWDLFNASYRSAVDIQTKYTHPFAHKVVG
jgi:hypothetical protein